MTHPATLPPEPMHRICVRCGVVFVTTTLSHVCGLCRARDEQAKANEESKG
jgi:hypothetical protein